MFDLQRWVPQSDVDERALAIGEVSSLEFVLTSVDLIALMAFMYQNKDSVVHDVQLNILFADGSETFFQRTIVGVGTSRLLWPVRTIATSTGSAIESRGSMIFSGPMTLRFINITPAVSAHTPIFNSRWLQAVAPMQSNPFPIIRVIS